MADTPVTLTGKIAVDGTLPLRTDTYVALYPADGTAVAAEKKVKLYHKPPAQPVSDAWAMYYVAPPKAANGTPPDITAATTAAEKKIPGGTSSPLEVTIPNGSALWGRLKLPDGYSMKNVVIVTTP